MLTTTKYRKGIKSPKNANVLKPGSNNKKLGRKVKSGTWANKYMYSLTLTERATCPPSCHHWIDCYGNNMPFAYRYSTEGLMPQLEREVLALLKKHKNGVVIRLHVLGDFYSVQYVEFWHRLLQQNLKLSIFGYTARSFDDNIGKAIYYMNAAYPDQCVIRHSGNYDYDEWWSYAADESYEGECFTCPEQTNKVKSCADCGLCWTTSKTVKFLSH